MLDKDIIYVQGKADFDRLVKNYFVNMENNIRTLHRTNGCYYGKCASKFITFDSMEEVEKYEAIHPDATPFRRCGNCFRKR